MLPPDATATYAGSEALPRCRQMLEMAEEVHAMAGTRSHEPVGKLRIATSISFAEAQLTAAVVDFQFKHPGVEIDLFAVDRAVNLVEERVDLAVRITNALDDSFVARVADEDAAMLRYLAELGIRPGVVVRVVARAMTINCDRWTRIAFVM